MPYFAIFKGWVCTANKDGSIPMNSKAIAHVDQGDESGLQVVIQQANQWQRERDRKEEER